MRLNKHLSALNAIGILFAISFYAIWWIRVLQSPLQFLPDDAFFYLQIAWNMKNEHELSFFKGLETNGFHPLWLMVCTVLSLFSDTKNDLVKMTAVMSLVITLSVVYLIIFNLSRWISQGCLIIATLMVLPFFLKAGFGMETYLTSLFIILFVAYAFRYQEKKENKYILIFSILCGLCVASRLDSVFIVAPVILGQFLQNYRHLMNNKGLMLFSLFLMVSPTGLWVIFNILEFGHPVPISGLLKLGNGGDGMQLTGVPTAITLTGIGSVCFAGFLRKHKKLSIYLGLYVGLVLYLVYLNYSGSREMYVWYLAPLSITVLLLLAISLASIVDSKQYTAKYWLYPVCIVAVTFGAFTSAKYSLRSPPNPAQNEVRILSQKQFFAELSQKNILTFEWPGQLAFLDGFNVIALDGLTSNYTFQKKLSDNGLDWLISTYKIKAFIGPSLKVFSCSDLMGERYLGYMRFECDERHQISKVEVFSRLTGKYLGKLDLIELETHEHPNWAAVAIYKFET